MKLCKLLSALLFTLSFTQPTVLYSSEERSSPIEEPEEVFIFSPSRKTSGLDELESNTSAQDHWIEKRTNQQKEQAQHRVTRTLQQLSNPINANSK